MKKYALIPLLYLCLACSDDNGITPVDVEIIEEEDNDPSLIDDSELNGYSFKDFHLNNGRMTDSIFYALDGNRIISSTDVQMNTREINSSEYTYIGSRLTKIASFYNGEPHYNRTFSYSRDGMTEMRLEVIRNNNSNQYYKYTYTHTADTIFMALGYGFDNINFTPVDDAKIVLDANDNIVFYENYNYYNDRKVHIHTEYDSNNNPLSEVHKLVEGDSAIPFRSDNIQVGESQNPLYSVLEATYGKKTFMMVYHVQLNDLGKINARTISPNAINSFETNASENQFTFEINNEVNEDGFTEFSSYKTFTQGKLYRHFEIEFIGK